MRLRVHSPVTAYATAVVASALAALVAWLLGPAIEPSFLPPFLAAVTLSAWCGGWRAGLVAILLSSVAIIYFHLPPVYSLAIGRGNGVGRLLLFLGVAGLINWLVAQLRAARLQAEQRQRQAEGSQQWMESLLNLMPAPLLLIEPHSGRIAFANRAAHTLTGGAGTVDGEGLPVARAARGEPLDGIEADWRTDDGSVRSLVVSSDLLPPLHGHPATAVMSLRDISDSKRAEVELQQRIRLLEAIDQVSGAIAAAQSLDTIFQLALDSIHATLLTDRAAILLMDRDADQRMRFTAWRGLSAAYRRATEGHTPWPAGAANPQPILVPDVTESRELAALRPAIVAEGIGSLAFIPLVATGQLIGKFMLYYDAPRRYSAAEIQTAQTIARHVAFAVERVRAEEAVRASEERLRLASRATNDAVWDWDLLTDGVEWNDAVSTVFGYPPGTVRDGANWWYGNIHPDDRDRVVSGVHATIEGGGQFWRDEYRFRRHDGTYALIIDRGYVLRDGNGRGVRMIGAMQDITERKEAEERLQALNQQLVVATLWAQELAREAEANERRASFLAEASRLLASSLDHADTLQQVAQLATTVLADYAIVDMVGENGSSARVAVAHADPARQRLIPLMHQYAPSRLDEGHPITRVLRTGQSMVIREVTDDVQARATVSDEHQWLIRELGARSYLIVPMAARGRMLGVMSFAYAQSGRSYTEAERQLAEDLARRAAVAVDNARLYQEAQEAIQRKGEALALLDTLLAGAPVGFAFNDHQHRFVRVNETLAALNGLPVAAHLGRTPREVLPEVGPAIEASYSRVLAGGKPLLNQEITGELPGHPGERRHWLASFYPVQADGGRLLGVGTVVLDITDRKRSEEESARLHREAEQIAAERAAILEQMPSGVIVFNAQGEATLVNEAARHILGGYVDFARPIPEQVQFYQGRQAAGEAQAPRYETPIGRALAGQTVHAEEYCLQRAGDPRDLWLQVSTVPLRDGAGHVTGGVTVFEDITPRKALEHLKDEFLSLAAHELKTPLATIKGNSQLLLFRHHRGRLPLPEADVETLRIINEKADYMGNLINELLDLSRAETGRLALHPEPTDLGGLLSQLVVQQRLLHPDTPFELDAPETPVLGAWDRGRLEQVFTNLLDNAVKYSSPGRPVRIRLRAADGTAEVRVQDEGIGIPARELPHLFERHFRAGNAGLSRSGLGLGLYLSRQIVERHGGLVTVESAEGEGSTFTVTLPLTGAQTAREQAA